MNLKLVHSQKNKVDLNIRGGADTYLIDQLFPEGRSWVVSPTSWAGRGVPGTPALGLLPPGQALLPLRPPAGEPSDLLGTISSSVLKSTAVGPAEKSSLQSLSRSGMLRALSSCSLERDKGDGWVWRTEDRFLLAGEAGVTVGLGVPAGPGGGPGAEPQPLLPASAALCREAASAVLDGDWVMGGARALASLWLSLQELRLRLRARAVASPAWLQLPEAVLPDERLPTGGLELTDRKAGAPALAAGRSELARFSKDLILCFTEKNEVDSWGQCCSE